MWVGNFFLTLIIAYHVARANFIQPMFNKDQFVLGASIEKALKAQHDDFKVLSHTSFSARVRKHTPQPEGIIGDFNGDKIKDLAVFIESKKAKKIIAYVAISNKAKKSYDLFSIYEFQRESNIQNMETYLNLGRKKDLKNGKRDLIQLETDEKSFSTARAFYYSLTQQKVLNFHGRWD